MFHKLDEINQRPLPFEFYTASDLWTDEHTAQQMLRHHLDPEVDISSRRHAFIDRSAAWIASHFPIGAGTAVADFGCGPGLYAVRLAKLGASVTGIDFSRNSIEYARQTAAEAGLSIQYVHQNYLEFETDARFDLIMMIMCDYCALSPMQRKHMLDKFRRLLKPGGTVLLDVYSLAAFEQREEKTRYDVSLQDGFWSPEKYYEFVNTFKYEPEKVALDKYTIIEADRIRQVYNWLQYFSPEALTQEFEAGGFRIDALYANVAGDVFDPKADEFAVAAR